MRTVIFRDDDASYFTEPHRLEAIYSRLWAAGLPVCLAVIPWVGGDTRVYWTEGNPPDPSVPPRFRGTAQNFPVTENRELCAFLNDKAAAGLVEICLHGLTHEFFEFITHDCAVIGQKLDEGRRLLERAFPAADIKTFVPPYDRVSPIALEELVKRGFHICTQSWNLAPAPHLPQLSGFAAGEVGRGQMLFVCDAYAFTHSREPGESLRAARRALAENELSIVCNHYWTFFHPWRELPNPSRLAAWNAFLDEALNSGDHEVTTFSAFAAGRTAQAEG